MSFGEGAALSDVSGSTFGSAFVVVVDVVVLNVADLR